MKHQKTYSVYTLDIGLLKRPAWSIRRCNATDRLATAVSLAKTASLLPCGSCDRTSPTLREYRSANRHGIIASNCSIEGSRKLQSSPGYLHVGQVPSKCTWQIPQTSSSGISHLHVATAFHFLIVTFIFELAGAVDRFNNSRSPLISLCCNDLLCCVWEERVNYKAL